jgi:hypothetical protein
MFAVAFPQRRVNTLELYPVSTRPVQKLVRRLRQNNHTRCFQTSHRVEELNISLRAVLAPFPE